MGEQTLTEERAQEILVQDLKLPAFAEKCAELGLRFSSVDQALKAYETAQLIKAGAQTADADIIDAAHSDVCAAAGVPTPDEQEAEAVSQQQSAEVAKDARVQAALAALTPNG